MDNVPIICRLCLNFIENDAYTPLQKNNSVLQSLNLISFSTIKNLQLTTNPVICKCCSKKLTELAAFKESIIANEFKIQCNKKNDPKSFLCSISEDINKICRLCLKVPINLKDLLISWKDSKVLLHNCNIHLNSDIAIPSKICSNCDRSLKKLGEFIVECTYNEKKIFNFASERGMLDSNQLIELFKIDCMKQTQSGKVSGKNSIIENKSNVQEISEYFPIEKGNSLENLTIQKESKTNKIENMNENNTLCDDTTKSEKCYRTYRRANCSILKNNISVSESENILKEIHMMSSLSTDNIDSEQPNVLDVTLGSEDDYNASDNGLQDLSDILDNQNETMNNEEPKISIEECNDHCIIMNIQLHSETSNICENVTGEKNNFDEIEFEIDLSQIVKTVPTASYSTSTIKVNAASDATVSMKTQSDEVNISPSTSKLEPRKLRNKRKAPVSCMEDIPIKRKNLKLDFDIKTDEENMIQNVNENNVETDTLNNKSTSLVEDKVILKKDPISKSTSVAPKKVGRPPKRRGRPPKRNKNINNSDEKQRQISNENIISTQDQSSSSSKLPEFKYGTCSNSTSNDNGTIEEVNQTDVKPFEVTIIRRNKRTTNKAELDKTWQKLTGKSVDELKDAPVKVLKKRGRKPNPNKVVPVKAYLVCPCCPFKTVSQNSFVQHQYIHNVLDNVASYKCKHCHFKTSNEELLKQHEVTHSAASLMFKCIFCDYSKHKKKISIMNHILRHDDKDVASMFYCAVLNQDTMDEYFECFQCDFQHPEEAVMPDHVIDHSRAVKAKNPLVAKFVCNFCSYRTKTEELLERHQELRHSNKNRITSEKEMIKIKQETPEDGLFKCDLCEYKTFHKRSLANHKSRHFRKPSEKKETGETYYCAECTYTTDRKVNLARHALVHKTKRNMEFFECAHCYFETKHRRSFTRHMETRHQVIV